MKVLHTIKGRNWFLQGFSAALGKQARPDITASDAAPCAINTYTALSMHTGSECSRRARCGGRDRPDDDLHCTTQGRKHGLVSRARRKLERAQRRSTVDRTHIFGKMALTMRTAPQVHAYSRPHQHLYNSPSLSCRDR